MRAAHHESASWDTLSAPLGRRPGPSRSGRATPPPGGVQGRAGMPSLSLAIARRRLPGSPGLRAPPGSPPPAAAGPGPPPLPGAAASAAGRAAGPRRRRALIGWPGAAAALSGRADSLGQGCRGAWRTGGSGAAARARPGRRPPARPPARQPERAARGAEGPRRAGRRQPGRHVLPALVPDGPAHPRGLPAGADPARPPAALLRAGRALPGGAHGPDRRHRRRRPPR